MYFNGMNDTNIDDEFGKRKKTKEKKETPEITEVEPEKVEEKPAREKKKIKLNLSEDSILTIFYGFLLIIGIVLIYVSLK